MPRGDKRRGEFSGMQPGELYRSIRLSADQGPVETALVKKKVTKFVSFCKWVNSHFSSLGKGGKFSKENREAVDFLDWNLMPEELAAASKFCLFLTILTGIAATAVIMVTPLSEMLSPSFGPALVPVYVFLPFIIAALAITNVVQRYPVSAANLEKTRALTYVPEIIGYMIMSMKLVPNLEKAIEFSAEHGSGKIAEDFKRLIWDVQLGVYNTMSEALDDLAYRWGRFSDEFKHALMKIRASILETTEAKRYQLLDSTMVSILDSIKNKMEQYARDLSQPSVLLFYMGVLLPLILIIILPVGSAFSGQPMATPLVLISIYNIAIPLVTFLFARDVISRRPPTQEIPRIPDDFPGLPKKNTMRLGKSTLDLRFVVLIVAVAGLGASYFISAEGLPPRSILGEEGFQLIPRDKTAAIVLAREGKPANYFDNDGPFAQELVARLGEEQGLALFNAERTKFFMKPENDVTPYVMVFGVLLTGSCCVAIFIYYKNIYKRKMQLNILSMESEFKDSLYILASRLGENRPVEEALKHTKKFLPDFQVSQRIFGRTVENIELLGMPLEAAVFDANYGSMKHLPSKTIQTGMRIMVDSVRLGVNVAARTLISLSLQLSNNEKVNRTLKTLISDTTSMMKTMAVFISPVVLGITTALQKVVMLTLSTIQSSNVDKTLDALDSTGVGNTVQIATITEGFSIDALQFDAMVKPWQFLVIVALYVIELVIIMVYFTTKIEEDNKLLYAINLAKALPVSVAVFLVSVIVSGMVVGGFFG
ncbi:MAG: type II secretion system F family protein [Candidatus Diapherotrites archaeon]|uniref:Type II secretion system F family protein n=1 Tax=Candidatus Iainarchaeum sp. TaxID=3101447 RepID=A0A938YTD5_9ARCH|nr:type II secretion system F family protein [Candidatus Diapherotrites archaeon]